jgi:predicted metal-dependent phosphoesterase TrpH
MIQSLELNWLNLRCVPEFQLFRALKISCQTDDGISVHMLGLLFDLDNAELLATMEKTRENRHGRMQRIIERINEAGIEISMQDVLAELSDGATLGRPHLADCID